MLKKIFLLLLICFSIIEIMGQKSAVDFTTVENRTLKYFNSCHYDSLIRLGKAALKNHLDYFHLRYRLGYAYFNKKMYRQAAKQFEKARLFNSMDENTLHYLYYSFKYSGNEAEAMAISKDLAPGYSNKKKALRKISVLTVYAEGGYGFTDQIKNNGNIDLDGDTNIYGESNLTRSVTYAHAGFKMKAGKNISIYQGYSFIDISKQKNVKRNDNLTKANYDILQHEYYINSDIRAYKTLVITPAFHFIYVSFNEPQYDTASLSIKRKLRELYNYTGSLMLNKDIWLMKLGLGGTFSYMNDDYKAQAMASVDFYPLGNLNLYTHSFVAFLYEDKSLAHHKSRRFILEQMIGFKIFNKLWSELDFTYGDLSNYVEKNAFVIYNFTDKTRFRAEINLISPIFGKFELSFRYQFFSKQNYYLTYTDYTKFDFKSMNYIQQNIIGGIKWKF